MPVQSDLRGANRDAWIESEGSPSGLVRRETCGVKRLNPYLGARPYLLSLGTGRGAAKNHLATSDQDKWSLPHCGEGQNSAYRCKAHIKNRPQKRGGFCFHRWYTLKDNYQGINIRSTYYLWTQASSRRGKG